MLRPVLASGLAVVALALGAAGCGSGTSSATTPTDTGPTFAEIEAEGDLALDRIRWSSSALALAESCQAEAKARVDALSVGLEDPGDMSTVADTTNAQRMITLARRHTDETYQESTTFRQALGDAASGLESAGCLPTIMRKLDRALATLN